MWWVYEHARVKQTTTISALFRGALGKCPRTLERGVLLFNSIASLRSPAHDGPLLNSKDPVGNRRGVFGTVVSLLLRIRILSSTLLLLLSAAALVATVSPGRVGVTVNTAVSLALVAILVLSILLVLGETLARRRIVALTSAVGNLPHGFPLVKSSFLLGGGELSSLAETLDSTSIYLREKTEELERSKQRFGLLCFSLPGVPYIYSSGQGDGSDVLYISPQVEKLLGYTEAEWQADSTLWLSRLHPDDQVRVLAEYTIACESGEPFLSEYRLLAKDDRVVWIKDEARISHEASGDQLLLGMMLDITAHRRDQAALKDNGARFAGILDVARDAIVSVDTKGQIGLFNKGAQKLMGYTESEMLGRNIDTLWAAEQSDTYTSQFAHFAAGSNRTGKLGTYGEVALRHKDGGELLAEATISQYVRGSDKVLTVFMRNITERRRIENGLKSSETSFRGMFGDNPLPMWVYDLDSLQILEVNVAAEARYGYSRREFLGMRMSDLKPAEDMPRLVGNSVNKESDGQYSIQVRHLRRDGRVIDVQLATQQLDFLGQRAALVVAEEITERKRAEEALRDSEQRFRAMFEGAAIGVALVELDGRYIKANPALQKMLGYSTDDMRDVRTASITHSEDYHRAQEAFKTLIEGDRDYYHLEQRYMCKDGSVVWANLTMSLVRGNKRKPQFCIAMVENITDRKHSQEQIKRQLERLAALRNIDLTISSSLDLRVTLNVILEQVMTQLKVDATNVLLLNTHTQILEYAAGRGFRYEGIARSRLRLGEGWAGRAALERRTLTVPNLDVDSDLARAHLLAGEDFVSYYAVPLLVKGQVKGVLEIFSRVGLNPQVEWLDFLESLASQAAIAIDNATMFNDLQRTNTELSLAYDTTLEGWSHALDLRDEETEGHTQRVTEMTDRLARSMGISDLEMLHVHRGALLHDIGKMGIPDSILLKPGPLTDEEWEIMRRHPGYAFQLLSPITFLKPALDIPYSHHEKWDGTGYPRGLKGEQIPLSARIFAVVDVYDALRSDRPYRKAWTEERVREHIRGLSGTHFDSHVVEVFLKMDVPRSKQTGPLNGLWDYIERKLVEDGELNVV